MLTQREREREYIIQLLHSDIYFTCFLGEIQWYEFCVSTPVNPEQSAKHFGELANAVQILHGYRREWTEDDIISILDELTSMHFNTPPKKK